MRAGAQGKALDLSVQPRDGSKDSLAVCWDTKYGIDEHLMGSRATEQCRIQDKRSGLKWNDKA